MTLERLKASRLIEWKQGGQPGPIRVTLFPTFRCNIRCSHCPKTWVDDPPRVFDEVPDDRWLKLVDEGANLGVREWLFAGGGEPMLRRDLVMAMVKRIRALGMNGFLQNNGTVIKEKDLETLVELGWAAVNVSIDGHTAEINDRVRFPNSFAKSTHVVRKLAELKRKQGSDATEIIIAHVVTALNYKHLPEMVELVHEMGGNLLHATDLIVFDAKQMEQLILTPGQRAELPGILRKSIARAEELGLRTNLQSLHDRQETANPATAAPDEYALDGSIENIRDVLCYEPFTSLTIISSGEVSPCCVFWEHEADNIRNGSLRDVWFGPYMSSLRQGMLSGKPHNNCTTCYTPWLQPQKDTKSLVETLENFQDKYSANPAKLAAKAARCLTRLGGAGEPPPRTGMAPIAQGGAAQHQSENCGLMPRPLLAS